MLLQMFNISDFSSDLHNQLRWLNYCFPPGFINIFVIPKIWSTSPALFFAYPVLLMHAGKQQMAKNKRKQTKQRVSAFSPLFSYCSTSKPWRLLWWISKPSSSMLSLDIEFVCRGLSIGQCMQHLGSNWHYTCLGSTKNIMYGLMSCSYWIIQFWMS